MGETAGQGGDPGFVWRAGVKCECIDDRLFKLFAQVERGFDGGPINSPSKGDRLTVREVRLCNCCSAALIFEEIRNSACRCGQNCGATVTFCAKYFRPLVSRPTSIEVFEEIRRGVERRAPLRCEPVEG